METNHPLRSAKWIWPERSYDMRNTYAQFRKDFRLAHVPPRAPFYITADQNYMLYVNGRYVGRGPARGYQVTWAYDEYDLAAHLVKGHNWISIRAYNGGISNFQYQYQWHAGLLCAARWGRFQLVSDASWPSRVSAAVKPDVVRVSRQMNLQEHVDARLDDQDWIRSARRPRDWPQTSAARPFGVMPWHSLEPRGLPNLAERMLIYQRTCTAAEGRCADGYQDTPNATDLLRHEWPKTRWHKALPGEITHDAFAFTLPAAGADRYAAVSVDLGQLSVGTLIVEADGAAGGEILDLFFCEALEPGGQPALVLQHVSQVSMSSRLRLRRGRTRFEFFHMMGHRYVTAIARDTRRPLRLRLSLRETIYPHAIKGRFECGDDVLNDIHRISVRTQQICSLDAYVDTPWREQAQWWGDARVQARNTFYISGDTRLLVRGIRCLARQEVPNGLTYGHAPTNSHGSILPDFSLIWALTLWDYYWQTGDASLVRQQWPRVERLLGYFTGEGRGRHGLLRYDERYWLFLDWTDIHKQGTPTLLNLWYVLTLEKLAALAGAAGMPNQRRHLIELWNEQKRRVLAKLWDCRKGLFRDGLTLEGRPVAAWSIHNQTLAILCGLKRECWPQMVRKRLLPYLQGRKVPGAKPSAYWVTYVYDVMEQLGYAREVVQHIRTAYAPMIPYGGTWETFDFPVGFGSTSHAWSAHPIYHLAGAVGGVFQADVAWRRIVFAPVLDLPQTDRATVVIPTPRGLVRAAWRRRDSTADVQLSLPRGVTAEVRLPGIRKTSVTGRNHWSARLD